MITNVASVEKDKQNIMMMRVIKQYNRSYTFVVIRKKKASYTCNTIHTNVSMLLLLVRYAPPAVISIQRYASSQEILEMIHTSCFTMIHV